MIFIDVLILPVSRRQTQKAMASEIRLNIEYLIRTYNFAHFVVEIGEKSSKSCGF